jgi:hypothetical protein
MQALVLFTNHSIHFRGARISVGEAMKNKSIGFAAVVAIAAALLVAAPSARAHHSFGAEYDFNKPVTLHGTVVKWEMINPHSYITLDAKNDNGSVTRWSVQAGAPSFLYRNGWRKDSVKPGDDLTISGYMARDGSHNVFGQQVKLPDGRRVLGGPLIGGTTLDSPDSLAPSKKSDQ